MNAWFIVAGFLIVVPVFGQHSPGYAGMQHRAIKALSEDEVSGLRAARGMALALPAELNGYPGPSHTLELAGPLGLSEGQRRSTQALLDQMRAEAMRLGEEVIAREHELDRLFNQRMATNATVRDAALKAAYARGELRAAHLRYHLLMLEVLNPEQVARYAQLRGYQ